MDQQHPIPQHISSYQFRLVGDMTLKQFFQLAAGLLMSLAFYASPLHPLIKWPFILFFALLGVALAFLPFEERPLSTWITAFFKSVYSPTLFSWQKSKTTVKFFQDEATAPSEKIITPKGEKAASEYLSGLSVQKTAFLTTLEEAEGNFLSRLGQIFGKEAQPTTQPTVEGPVQETVPASIPIPQAPPPPPAPRPKIITVEERPAEVKLQGVAPTLVGKGISGAGATFSLAAAPPNPPTVPNTVVGQVFDSEGKIIEGAILEIRDVSGLPVRALRSNKVGHFIIVTPLSNGSYQIITEKEGFIFDPVTFEAGGAIIPPIAIHAKGVAQPTINNQQSTVQPAQL